MYISARKLSIIIISLLFIFIFSKQSFSQTVQCPQGYICLTQQEANVARDNALELKAVKEKIIVLTNALDEKDKSINELKSTAQKNEADLKDALHKTEIELATTKGQLIGSEAEKTRLTAIIDFMLKNGRKKCQPFSVCIN